MRRATDTLRQVLAPLGIEPQLEVADVDVAAFSADPLESNRIWIANLEATRLRNRSSPIPLL